jgi:hypothetical protein
MTKKRNKKNRLKMATMKQAEVLHNKLYTCDIPNSRQELGKRRHLSDNNFSGNKCNSDTSNMKSEMKKDLFLGSQKVNFKELQMDNIPFQGLSNDKSKRKNSLTMDLCNDNSKSNIQRSSASQVRFNKSHPCPLIKYYSQNILV